MPLTAGLAHAARANYKICASEVALLRFPNLLIHLYHLHSLPHLHLPKNPKHTPQAKTKTNTHLKSHLVDVKI
jgi:hypothetical protein